MVNESIERNLSDIGTIKTINTIRTQDTSLFQMITVQETGFEGF